jgi:hypothetical protein
MSRADDTERAAMNVNVNVGENSHDVDAANRFIDDVHAYRTAAAANKIMNPTAVLPVSVAKSTVARKGVFIICRDKAKVAKQTKLLSAQRAAIVAAAAARAQLITDEAKAKTTDASNADASTALSDATDAAAALVAAAKATIVSSTISVLIISSLVDLSRSTNSTIINIYNNSLDST